MNFNWHQFENSVKNKRIIGYGTGAGAYQMLLDKRFTPFLNQLEYFVDMDPLKHGQKIIQNNLKYHIFPVEKIYGEFDDIIVMVTISDYIKTGQMLDEKNITWVPWNIISSNVDLANVFINKDSNKASFLLMNTPNHTNLGDHAIAVAEYSYLEKIGEYYEFTSSQCTFQVMQKLHDYLNSDDIIFFHGGGNLGTLWRTNEEVFRSILTLFPDNPVIVFPQSVYYGESPEEMEYFRESQKVYNSHKNLLICTRDKRSYEFIGNSYNCKCMLLPDVVLTLEHQSISKRKGVGVVLRHDKEQFLSENYESVIDNVIAEIGEKKIFINHQPSKIITNRKAEIDSVLQKYSKCKLIITDRLHGMIFSAITNTPCIAFDNSYHKVSDLYKTWLENCPNITVSKLLSHFELLELVKKMLISEYTTFNSAFFAEKFNSLTDYINKQREL